MRRPPRDYQETFRRAVVQACRVRSQNLNVFIDDLDYDQFLEAVLPGCSSPRQVLAEFSYKVMAKAATRYRPVLCMAVVQFCIEMCEIDGIENAEQAMAALRDIDFARTGEMSKWIDAYCHGFRSSR